MTTKLEQNKATMSVPNFIGIGVQRAATTWLTDCLSEHPDVYLPPHKELHFFNFNYHKGLQWYRSQFNGHDAETAVGEFTPLYFHTAPLETIRHDFPDAKLILILREPVDRTFSSYCLMRETAFPGLSFSAALGTARGAAVLGYSLYADKLEKLLEIFPKEQILIEIYDDVIAEPQRLYSRVCNHIGVDASFVPSRLSSISNRIILPGLQERLNQIGLRIVVDAVKATPLGTAIKQWSKKQQKQVDNSEELREFRRLHAERICGDILRCQEMIGRDLSCWLDRWKDCR